MSIPLDKQDDEELAQRTAAGSTAAFEELVRRYGRRILGFVRQRSANPTEAEDLTQQTFIQAYQRIHQFNDQYRFKSWLFTIARNLTISHYRATSRRPEVPAMEQHEDTTTATPASQLAAAEGRNRLWQLARQHLSEDQFTALWMHYAEDMRTREIAEFMACSNSNVKVLLHRARKKLASGAVCQEVLACCR